MLENEIRRIENSIIIGLTSDVNSFLLTLDGNISDSVIVLDNENDSLAEKKERREILEAAIKQYR